MPPSIAAVKAIVAQAPGQVSVVVRDRTGVVLDVDGDRVVPAASTIKVPVLLAALRAVQEGRLSLRTPVPLDPQRVGGSGALHLLASVTEVPLAEALDLMVALSDNDATNAVIRLLGDEAVARLATGCGLDRTRLQRPMMDTAAAAAGRDNLTCAGDLARVLAALRQGAVLDEQHTRLALEVLGRRQCPDGLPAFVPAHLWVGSKSGDLPGIRHDMALLELDGRWASVAVTATGLVGPEGADLGAGVLPSIARVGAAVAGWLATAPAGEDTAVDSADAGQRQRQNGWPAGSA